MPGPSDQFIPLIERTIRADAPDTLNRDQAKLYSHYSKLKRDQRGLTLWSPEKTTAMYLEAIRLFQAAFIDMERGNSRWTKTLKRGAEILEWLSEPQINLDRASYRLLSAAAYQLAGYPAMAAGVINRSTEEEPWSPLFKAFLKADFPGLLSLCLEFWVQHPDLTGQNGSGIIFSQTSASSDEDENSEPTENPFHDYLVAELVRCLGVIAAEMRWNTRERMDKTFARLQGIATFASQSYDQDMWLLIKLIILITQKYLNDSMFIGVGSLKETVDADGEKALNQYIRRSYESQKSILWPSQKRGIESLSSLGSFALCTPTGSGKTTIAELGIIQSLFLNSSADEEDAQKPIVMFLVPSRALAGEVEAKFAQSFKHSGADIMVTGLYGGTDWGPTDAWLTFDVKTLLICTYEKAEALIRFLGPKFMSRVRAVIIDEAHAIAYGGTDREEEYLKQGENRSLRLEVLGMRMFTYLNPESSRIIALSAVAADTEKPLASWVAGSDNQSAITLNYRSTRQLIGRMECFQNGTYEIQFDILDRVTDLSESIDINDSPYITNPIPPCPTFDPMKWRFKRERGALKPTQEKEMWPFTLWAAMSFAALDNEMKRSTVLISITARIENTAAAFLQLLEEDWPAVTLPEYFTPPDKPDDVRLLEECLELCADLCGENSFEYKLLSRGMVLHHGGLPTRLRHLFTQLVDKRIIHIVIATSTLSEGVNLPFEYILVPVLKRGRVGMPAKEFLNLAGRAGRPGTSTEGITLVMMPSVNSFQRTLYRKLKSDILTLSSQSIDKPNNSALGELLQLIHTHWLRIHPTGSHAEFQQWLEVTAPLNADVNELDLDDPVNILDTLDTVLLSSLEEIEKLSPTDLPLAELEEQLKAIWSRSYAAYSTRDEERLMGYFLKRATSLKQDIYPTRQQRQKLYYAGLPPRKGQKLIDLYQSIKAYLITGIGYAQWNPAERANYIVGLVAQFDSVDIFELPPPKIGRVRWEELLQWWLAPTSIELDLEPKNLMKAQEYVEKNFIYKINWWIGNILAYAMNEAIAGSEETFKISEWPRTELPWIAFWIKELITWGTLDPVAAYLMSIRQVKLRNEAETKAHEYYRGISATDEAFNPLLIREWSIALQTQDDVDLPTTFPKRIPVHLDRDFRNHNGQSFFVFPIAHQGSTYWLDSAGYLLARNPGEIRLNPYQFKNIDFQLHPNQAYISHSYA